MLVWCRAALTETPTPIHAGIKGKEDVLAMGIDKYNEACRSIVMRYSKEWETTVKRVGRWIDFENDYKTLDPEFMVRDWHVSTITSTHSDSLALSIHRSQCGGCSRRCTPRAWSTAAPR